MANSSSSFTALTDGTGAVPVYTFINDLTTGLYHPTGGALGFAADGVSRMTLDNVTLDSTVTYRAPNGTAAFPAFTFSGDPDLGIYRASATSIGVTTEGVSRATFGSSVFNTTVRITSTSASAALPSYSFSSDLDTGMFSGGTNIIGFSTGGATRMSISATAITASEPVLIPVGAASTPGLAFSGDTNTGIYSTADDVIGLVAGGVENLRVTSSTIRSDGVIRVGVGSVTAPSYTWQLDQDTGMYRSAADEISFATNGVQRLRLADNGLFAGRFYTNDGNATLPAHSFTSDLNTGMFLEAADQLAFSTGGTNRVSISTTQFVSTLPYRSNAGTAANPQYTFISDSDSGMYSKGANDIGFATAGSLRASVNTTGISIFGATSGSITFAAAATTTPHTITMPADNAVGVLSNNGSGVLSWTGGSTFGDGSAVAPSITFTSDTNTGLYSVGADILGFTVGGTQRLRISDSAIFSTEPFFPPAINNPAIPSYSFNGDTDTGMYWVSANVVGFTCGGTSPLQLSSGNISCFATLRIPDGTVAIPGLIFNNDTNTGIYRPAADELSISVGGVQACIFKDSPLGATPHLEMATGLTNGPSYSFVGDTDTGMWSGALGEIDFSCNAATVLTISNTAITSTEPYLTNDGTTALPAYSFTSDTNTGMFSGGADIIGFSCGGATRMSISSTTITCSEPVIVPNGTAGAPGLAFSGGTTDGIYRAGTNIFGIVTSGVERLRLSAAAVQSAEPIFVPDGTAGAPTYSFTSDSNTGMYRAAADTLQFSTGGTERMRIDASGRMGIGRTPTTNALEVNGDASKTASGSWLANSDERIKENIKPIENGIETIKKLNPCSYTHKKKYAEENNIDDKKTYVNFIAQEYEKIFPEDVQNRNENYTDEDGKTHENIKSIDVHPVLLYLVKAVQELSEKVEKLESEK